MSKVVILDHPLIEHKMAIIRNIKTNSKEFKENLSEIGSLITYEITRDFKTITKEIETPVAKTIVKVLEKPVVIVPILRAGLGMVEGIHNMIRSAKIGHIGLFRDEKTFTPNVYFKKFPSNLKDSIALLVDPMLATGNSAVKGIDILKEAGAKEIIYVGLVASEIGLNAIKSKHPDVSIYLAALDQGLDENGYIIPGLGDCGDRLFGTK